MNVAELARRFVGDLLRLPLVFKLFVLYGAGAAGWQWWKVRQQAMTITASAAWPVYRARVVWAQVSDHNGRGEDEASYWEGLLTYSYTVPGHDLEIGEFRKRFSDEEEADQWARALRDTYVDVRVDPADVKRSVWQETPVLTAPSLQVPELDGSRLQAREPWGIDEVSATLLFCVSAVGSFLAGWIQLSCLRGKPLITAEQDTTAFFGMHIGAIVCGVASNLVASDRRSQGRRWNWRNSFKKGSAAAAIMKVLGIYSTAVFVYGWVRGAANDGNSPLLGVLMFSAIWLLFYSAAALASLSAVQHRGGEPS